MSIPGRDRSSGQPGPCCLRARRCCPQPANQLKGQLTRLVLNLRLPLRCEQTQRNTPHSNHGNERQRRL